MLLFQPLLAPVFTPVRRLSLDTRWINDRLWHFRLLVIQRLLLEVRNFSKIEFLELIVKNARSKTAISKELIQEALENLDEDELYRSTIWQLVQISGPESVKASNGRCPKSMNCLLKTHKMPIITFCSTASIPTRRKCQTASLMKEVARLE